MASPILSRFFPLPQPIRKTIFLTSCFAYTYLAYSFIDTFLFRLQWVEGVSMSPTLSPHYHDRGTRDLLLIYNRFFHSRPLRRGDVVRFTKPHDPESEGVKRVVALPGDTVVRRMGDGGREARKLGLRECPPVVVVPEGHVWVEGDNWRRTLDSNDYGPISMNLISGTARGIVWPFSRMGRIDEGPTGAEKSRTHVIKGNDAMKVDWGLI